MQHLRTFRQIYDYLRKLKWSVLRRPLLASDPSHLQDARVVSRFNKLAEEANYLARELKLDSTELKMYHLEIPRATWLVHGGVFFPQSAVFAVDRYPIAESKTRFSRAKLTPLENFSRPKSPRKIGTWVPLTNKPWNYYHWMVEDLPSVLRAKGHTSQLLAALPPNPPRYVRESLRQIGVPWEAFRSPAALDEVILPGRGNDSAWPRTHDLEIVRSAVMAGLGPVLLSEKPIWVSRRRARRSPIWEEKLENFLQSMGFQIICAQQMDFMGQVEVFSRAPIVAGLHGAGLTNGLFLESGAKLIEVCSNVRINPCFENLAGAVGLRYKRIVLEQELFQQRDLPTEICRVFESMF